MKVDIHKNVLSPNEYEILDSAITNDEFPWYFSPHHLESTYRSDEPNLYQVCRTHQKQVQPFDDYDNLGLK